MQEILVDIYKDGVFSERRSPDTRLTDNLVVINLTGGSGGDTDADSVFLESIYGGNDNIVIPAVQILLDEENATNIGLIKTQTDQLNFTGDDVKATLDSETVNLSATGLDNIPATEPSGRATTFRQMLIQTWMRFFNKVDRTATQVRTYDDSGNVITTQNHSESGGTETVNKSS